MIEKNKINFYLYFLIIILITTIGCFLRIYYYYLKIPFIGDETNPIIPLMQYSILHLPFKDFEAGEIAGPLLFLTQKIIACIFGINLYSMRFLSLIAGLLSCILFPFFACCFLKNKFSVIIATFLFSFNITVIYYSTINKPYSIDIMLSVLLLYSAVKYLSNKNYSFRSVFFLSLLCLIFYLYSFPMIFIIPSVLIVQFIKEFRTKNINKKNVICITLLGFINILIISLYYFLYLHNITNDYNIFEIWKTDYGFFPNSYKEINSLVSFLFDQGEYNPYSNPVFVNSVLILFIMGLFLYLLQIIRNKQDNLNKYNFLTITLPIILTLTAGALSIYPFQHRVILFLLPSFIIIIAKTCDFIDKKHLLTGLIFILTFISAIQNSQIIDKYNYLYCEQKETASVYDDIYKYLNSNVMDNDVIYVDISMFLNIYVYNHIYNYKPKNILFSYHYPNLCQDSYNHNKYILSRLKEFNTIYVIQYTKDISLPEGIKEYLEENYSKEEIMGYEYTALLSKYTKN